MGQPLRADRKRRDEFGSGQVVAGSLRGHRRPAQMPPFASESFETWFGRRSRASANGRPKVVLFHDCFLNYNYPHVGHAATELLEAAGFEVVLANKKCCGRPMISKGLIDDAKAVARHTCGNWSPM